ncbi:MAG: DUF2284 domain-containing protein [Eubacteriaceae bacterium]|nr:DUF2284 domain-containing protein [Eubacteriaceae bacterium]
MKKLEERLIETFGTTGFFEHKKIKFSDVIITQDVFNQCERNICGNFGKNHACPPKAGSEEVRVARVEKYDDAYLVNIVLSIKNREDMMNSGVLFNEATSKLRKVFENDDVFVMGAGPCTICEKCSALEEEPCRFPEKTQYSMEGCGIDVMRMSMNFKMTYNAGMGNAAFFCLVLYRP